MSMNKNVPNKLYNMQIDRVCVCVIIINKEEVMSLWTLNWIEKGKEK